MSDYRVRGYSMSDGNPAASIALSYDHPSGFYAGGAVVGSFHDDDPGIAGLQGALGYALRVSPSVSLDGGVSRSYFTHAYGTAYDLEYTELYVGVAVPHLTARLNYSPDYSTLASSTLYAEVETGFEPATDWSITAHAGLFSYLGANIAYLSNERYDWKIGASRRLGATSVALDASGRIQGSSSRAGTNATALVLSISHAF
jgi:uncharacterized protein (TIGR02001 family)